MGRRRPFRNPPDQSPAHAKRALLSIPGAVIVDQDDDDEAVFAEVDAAFAEYGPDR